MKLVDTNVLVYAGNTEARHHESSRRWLDNSLSGAATVAFSWIALLAFVRLSTKAEVFPRPLSLEEAIGQVEGWLGSHSSVLVEPTAAHLRIVQGLLEQVGMGGNLVNDAHLAALAIEHKAVVVSYDNDFDRFEGVSRETPTG